MNRAIRVRFAPSPTGPLHIGGVRTALYNYLFARKNNGQLILRIEDTDQTRFVPGAEQYIIESLEWCGIRIDEGVEQGGPHAPYRQSERKEIYRQYAETLVKKGQAYYAFDTPEELEQLRKQAETEKKTFVYNAAVRGLLKNSLTFSPEETSRKISSGEPYVIRFRIPETGQVKLQDLIRGDVTVECAQLDDKVIFKADGLPTYHLANVVDDYRMEITHVIRGEEWLPSAPLHVLLYRGLGLEDKMPQFAHLPLLLKPDGKGKLSKRDGDRLGFPVFPLNWTDPATGEVSSGFRESGYFPEAFINMMALLGWNPGTEQEIFSMEELIPAFSLERVGKSGSRFDPEKSKWFNRQYLMQKTDEALRLLFMPILQEKNLNPDQEYVLQVIRLVRERADFIKDLWDQGCFFFTDPVQYDPGVVGKRWTAEMPGILKKLAGTMLSEESWTQEKLESGVKAFIDENKLNPGQIMNVLRLCMVGSSMGPDLFSVMALLGKETVNRRIENAVAVITKNKPV